MSPLFRFSSVVAGAVVTAGLVAGGCTTFSNARPLAPGQHAVAVTAGGPLTTVPGIGQIPLPNVTVEGRSGVMHHLDVNYGVHLLPALYGAPGAHVGATLQLFDQPEAVVPALSVGQRLFGFTNVVDERRTAKAFYALSQTDLTASWEPLPDQLFYVGATAYAPLNGTFDFDDTTPSLVHFAPFAGLVVSPGVDWLQLNLEGRWLSPSTDQRFAVVDWIGPDDKGAWAVNAGASLIFSDLWGALVNGGRDAPSAVDGTDSADSADSAEKDGNADTGKATGDDSAQDAATEVKP